MTNKEIREKWEKSDLAQRIKSTELFAINHGFPEWSDRTIVDFWIDLIAQREGEIVWKIKEKKGEGGRRLNIYGEGYKDGLNKGLKTAIDIIKKNV